MLGPNVRWWRYCREQGAEVLRDGSGILVIATDQEVTAKDAIYVGIDQKAWAMKSAEW